MVEKGNNLDRTLRSLSSYLVENEVIEGWQPELPNVYIRFQ
jgi:hypothetical protein